jgi:hypothetical protein
VNFLKTNTTNEDQTTRPTYLYKLNRNQCSTLFKAKNRMLQVKINFKDKYKNIICRGCGTNIEAQAHVL